jgi:hexulose-6-phosphate isomerase
LEARLTRKNELRAVPVEKILAQPKPRRSAAMLKGINYWAFLPSQKNEACDLDTAFTIARDQGFDCFELTIDEKGPLTFQTSQTEAVEIRKKADDYGLKLLSVATLSSWSCSPTDPDPEIRNHAIANHAKIIEIASWLGAGIMLYIPGMVSAWWIPQFKPQPYDRVKNWAEQAIERLIPIGEKFNVKIAIENVANRFLMSPLEMNQFINYFNSPFVGSYFDIGNSMIYGYPEHWIKILNKHIIAVHLKDFKAYANGGFMVDLLGGDVNYPSVIHALTEIGYEGAYTVEIVPATLGGIEKASTSLKIIEKMR